MAANWDDMKVALAIARAGSMTRAAEALGIDQSTCGRRLGPLEAALFVRSKSGLSPTEAGEAAIARASEIELRMGPALVGTLHLHMHPDTRASATASPT